MAHAPRRCTAPPSSDACPSAWPRARADYVLVSRGQLAARVVRATVHGRGAERSGFLGSDHCPLIVELGPIGEGGGAAAAGGVAHASVGDEASGAGATSGAARDQVASADDAA